MEKLKRIASKVFNLEESLITLDFSRECNEEWDSFNHLLLINEIEKDLDIRFTLEEVEKIKTFKDLISCISLKKG